MLVLRFLGMFDGMSLTGIKHADLGGDVSPKDDFVTQPAFTCSKLTMETLEQSIFIVNFKHILRLVLVFLLLTLSR